MPNEARLARPEDLAPYLEIDNKAGESDYRNLPAISQSDVKAYEDDSELFFERLRNEAPKRKPSESMTFGKRLEAYVFADAMPAVIVPDSVLNDKGERRNRKGETQWSDWKDNIIRQHGESVELLKQFEFDKEYGGVIKARRKIEEHPKAANLLLDRDNCEYHQTLSWFDEEFGVNLKCEIDVVWFQQVITDLKSTKDPRPEDFSKSIHNFGYHVQAWWYRRAMKAMTGELLPYVIVAVKNTESYFVETYELDHETIALGEAIAKPVVFELVAALKANNKHRPTHGKITKIGVPPWAFRKVTG